LPKHFQGGKEEVERIRRQQPRHVNARIQETTITIVISMVILKRSVGSHIQRLIQEPKEKGQEEHAHC
jgi:hypothetical protein